MTPSITIGRPFSGWIGRLFAVINRVNAAICAAEGWIGVIKTIHCTPSEQGGVVSDPS